MSEDLSEIKSKITSKSTTKVNPYLNQAIFMIEFCLFLSHMDNLAWFVSAMSAWKQLIGTTH